MSLNWNEIKSRALLFSKTWGDASLFALYMQANGLLPTAKLSKSITDLFIEEI
jgi:hypothetical protein